MGLNIIETVLTWLSTQSTTATIVMIVVILVFMGWVRYKKVSLESSEFRFSNLKEEIKILSDHNTRLREETLRLQHTISALYDEIWAVKRKTAESHYKMERRRIKDQDKNLGRRKDDATS
jgi:cell division protein FtsB